MVLVARLPAVFSALLLAASATVSAVVVPRHPKCNTGALRCCNSLTDPKSEPGANDLFAGLLGGIAAGLEGSIGVGCSPLDVLGLGESACQSYAVCCKNNAVGSLISIGCIPVML